jgi:hypothetical protein
MPICVQPYFRIVNTGGSAISLADYSIRYYYTKEASVAESYSCYYTSSGDCNQVAPAHFVNVSPTRPGADRYVEISFTPGATSVKSGSFVELQGGFCLQGDAMLEQADDYSYTGSSDFMTTSKVTLFKQGVLVWGQPP